MLTILDLVDADREGRLMRVTQDVLTFRRLRETFEDWVKTHPIATKTRKDYRGQRSPSWTSPRGSNSFLQTLQ